MTKCYETYSKLDGHISSLESKESRELEKLLKYTNAFNQNILSFINISIESLTEQQNELKINTKATLLRWKVTKN